METSIRATLYLPSRPMAAGSLVRQENREPIDVFIGDLTIAGCRMLCPVDLDEHQEGWVDLPGIGMRSCRIGRSHRHALRCEFQKPLDFSHIEMARRAHNDGEEAVPAMVPLDVRGSAMIKDRRLTRRHRLTIIILAGIGAWLLFYAFARLGNALLASGF